MRFYQECVHVAQSIGALMNTEQMESFITAVSSEYRCVFGMWIGNRLLPHNTYLSEALTVLGKTTVEEKILFLIDFAQQYWQLRCANML